MAAADGSSGLTRPTRDVRHRARRLLVRIAGQHRRVLLGAVLGGIGWQLAGIVVPVVVGRTIDRGIVGGDRAAIWIGGIALVALGVVEAGCAAIRHRMATTAYMGATADQREWVTAAALALDADARQGFGPGEVLSRETSDADTVAGLFDSVGHTIAEAISIPVIVTILWVIDPTMAVVVGLVLPMIVVVMWRASAEWERRSASAQTAMGATITAAQETVEGFKVLRGIGAEPAATARFTARSERLRDRAIDLGRLWLSAEPLLEVLSAVPVVVVLWIGGGRAIEGATSLGSVVTAVGLVLFLAGPVRTVGARILTFQTAMASAVRVVGLLDAASPSDLEPDTDPCAGTDGLDLDVDAVTVTAWSDDAVDRRVLVEDVDITVAAGSLVVFDGATGSGKSSVLAVMAGLARPGSGTVRLGGLDLADWPSAALRRRVVVCGPSPFLFSGTIADNLRFADPGASTDAISEALDATACDFVRTLPGGLSADVSERGVTLSGGQRQRLALARAVLGAPSVLVIDGGTAALDPETDVAVVTRLRALRPAMSIVVVTANPEVRSAADRVLTIHERRVIGAPT